MVTLAGVYSIFLYVRKSKQCQLESLHAPSFRREVPRRRPWQDQFQPGYAHLSQHVNANFSGHVVDII